MLSGRLTLNAKAIDNYGIKLLGNKIEWIGQTESFKEIDKDYNYIDSSYMRILINNGILILVFVLYYLSKLIDYAYDKEDYFLLFLLLIIEFYCFFDSFLISIQFNTMLMLLGNKINLFKIEDKRGMV